MTLLWIVRCPEHLFDDGYLKTVQMMYNGKVFFIVTDNHKWLSWFVWVTRWTELLLKSMRLLLHAGFHEFCEFTAEDVGTVDSGLNSVVLANNNE